MQLDKAYRLARSEMDKYELKDWKFEFDRAKSRFGLCSFTNKTISLSTSLTELNSEDEVKQTILHEIAHALIDKAHGHNMVWRRKAIEIGHSGERCYSRKNVTTPPYVFTATCSECNDITYRRRCPKNVACGKCCRKYNDGKFLAKYKLTYTKINKDN